MRRLDPFDPLDPFDRGPAGRLSLPLLPTLATVALLTAASLACREPARPAIEPGFMPAVGPTAFFTPGADRPEPRATALLAFGAFYPLAPAGTAMAEARAVPSARPAPRFAATPTRRPCPGPRCADHHREAMNRPAAAPEAMQAPAPEADEPGALQDLALPFAPLLTPAAVAAGEAAALAQTAAAAATALSAPISAGVAEAVTGFAAHLR